MTNKENKPKLSSSQLISKIKIEKSVTFEYISELDAKDYIEHINNYFRTAAYRKNFQKYNNGIKKGKYISLDFAYLKELSTIDMHLRFLITRMCLDVEHDLKIKILEDINNNQHIDCYDIVKNFLSKNNYILNKIESAATSPFSHDLINKYFKSKKVFNTKYKRYDYKIISFDDCPVWVLFEIITFGDLIKFYSFYYSPKKTSKLPISILILTKNLRNAAVHNNCILSNLNPGTSVAPNTISIEISKIKSINANQRKKKLSSRPTLEFVCLLYVYKLVVSNTIKQYRINELKDLFFNRMKRNKEYFKNNDLIKSNYEFICKTINAFF